MIENILSLDSKETMAFMMKTEHFHNFELPEYFDFNQVLAFVQKTIGNKKYDDCLSGEAATCEEVNFDILLNKDGKYAVRPLVLCNPYLYYFLVREICGKNNWKRIKENFEKCTAPHITSCAMPVIPKEKEGFHNSTIIFNWWQQIEQRSLELSLEYRYMFVTDITNCYGSINPQSIDWALSRKGTTLHCDDNHTLAANIIRYLSDMQQGRNIGIPQGSTIFDLTAEIVLSYADLLLHEAIEAKRKEGVVKDSYEILRYRDDYRVFCNDKGTLEVISYTLQQVLEKLNFRMNSNKTRISDSVVTDSVKPDKLWYIENTPIVNKEGCDFDNNFQKHLLYILLFGRKHPNSGQLRVMLSNLNKRIARKIEEFEKNKARWEEVDLGTPGSDELLDDSDGQEQELDEKKVDAEGYEVRSIFNNLKVYEPTMHIGNIRAMCAIATQIALENVVVANSALQVISQMISTLKKDEVKIDIIKKVFDKMKTQANSTYNMLWLQNMTYKIDKATDNHPYKERLCRLVMGEDVDLWNNEWLKKKLTKGFPLHTIVNAETLDETTGVINFRERFRYDEVECEKER